MKEAFTMIELIFVIVIIGILSAVAIPKLAATRDDAKVVAIANQVSVAANEIAAYAVSRGKTESNFITMSNAVETMISKADAQQMSNVLNIRMNTISNCLMLTVSQSTLDSNLTLSYGAAGSDQICISLQSAIDASAYPIPLRGIRIVP